MNDRYTTIATYTDRDDLEHEIAVLVERGGRFAVLDLSPVGAHLVERFRDFDDYADIVEACARDYAAQIADYLAGDRDDMPTAHPLGLHPVNVELTAAAQSSLLAA